MALSSVNPATGEVLARFDEISEAELEAKLARAQSTFRTWRKVPFAERARVLVRAAEVLEADKARYGRMMTLEMGKTLTSAVAEAEKCAWACRYYAEHGERFLSDEEIQAAATRSYVRFLPLGPVLAVMPWNFPFWQVFRRAGAPEGAFQTLLVGSARVARILEDDRVAAATLTGSEAAGAAVASAAGKVIKKTVLELGGSDPFIVMPSADLDRAVATAVTARVINNGQSCIAAKRFIVHETVYDRFERGFVDGMRKLRVGDPLDPATDVGPISSAAERDKLIQQVEAAVKAGAKLLLGGTALSGKGAFFPPTVLVGIPRSSTSYRDEIFGPVAALYRARDVDEAIAIANDVPFGLSSSVWTNDPEERRRLVDDLEAGATFVNAMSASDPRLPFGGIKRSGYGRELSREGIREFVNLKSVAVFDGPAAPTAKPVAATE